MPHLLPAPEGQDAGVRRHHGAVARHGAMHVLQGVLEVAHALLPAILQGERRHRLEAAPASGEQQRVAALQQLGVPPVPLDPHLHQPHAALARQQAAQYDRPLPLHLRHARRWHVVEPHAHEGCDGHAVGKADEVCSADVGHRALVGAGSGLPSALSCWLVALSRFGLPIFVLLRAAPAAGDELPFFEGLPGLLIECVSLTGQAWHPRSVDAIKVPHVPQEAGERTALLRLLPRSLRGLLVSVEQWNRLVVRGLMTAAGRCCVRLRAFARSEPTAVDHLLEPQAASEATARGLEDVPSVLLGVTALGPLGVLLSLLLIVVVVALLVLCVIRLPAVLDLEGPPCRDGVVEVGSSAPLAGLPGPGGLAGLVLAGLLWQARGGSAQEPQARPRPHGVVQRALALLHGPDELDGLRQLAVLVLALPPGEAHLHLRQVDVHGVGVHGDAAHLGARRVDDAVPLREAPQHVLLLRLLALGLVPLGLHFLGMRTGVWQRLDGRDREIANPGKVRLRALAQPAAADVAVEVQAPGRLPGERGVGLVLPAQGQHVGVALPPRQQGRLGNGDEARQVLDLVAVVAAILQAAEVEELGALVHLGPEAVLQRLLGLPQLLVVLEDIQVGEHADDAGEAVHLEDVDELEGFELETEGGIDEEEDQVCHFGKVQHR
mmetsp:Transcript_45142/g.130690  ORF Transcript_45142/g.130690 Transcript_45142/m.130690 type:complete len:662 (-) Transcript_45142:545-2530(-)